MSLPTVDRAGPGAIFQAGNRDEPDSAAADVDGPRQTSRSTSGRFYFPASTASFLLQSMPKALELLPAFVRRRLAETC